MKTKIATLVMLALASMVQLRAQEEKTVQKSFAASTLSINNSFGDVDVTTYVGSKIEMTVVISVTSSSKSSPAKELDKINIEVKEIGNRVDVSTKNEISNQKGVREFRIDYTVKMPENTNLIVKNSFGNTTVARVKGTLEIRQQHGDCYVGEAIGANNTIKVQFGRLNGGAISNADVDVQHGNSTIASFNNVEARQQFGNMKVGELQGVIKVNASHGSFKSDRVLPALTRLTIESQFGAVELSEVPKQGYRIDLSGSFSTFKWPDHMKVIESEKEITSASYQIQSQNGGEKLIDIHASHGSVKIY